MLDVQAQSIRETFQFVFLVVILVNFLTMQNRLFEMQSRTLKKIDGAPSRSSQQVERIEAVIARRTVRAWKVIALQGRLAEHRPLLAERLTVPGLQSFVDWSSVR